MMLKPTHRMLLVVAALLIFDLARAQDATFRASVDKNPVGVGEDFTLQFTLGNAGTGGGRNLKIPDLGGFRIMSGPNQASSMQIINGAVSSYVTYSYILQAKNIGRTTIGPATIDVGGKTIQANSITLDVVKASAKPRQQAAAQDQTVQLGDNLFLKASVSKTHVIQGEQINVVFKIYTRVSVVKYGVDKTPAMTGFWSEDVETPQDIALSNETVNGKTYRVGIIKRVALFPTQSGTLEISPMGVQATVQIQNPRSNDPFESFFRDPFGRNETYSIKSEPVRITVDPLPSGAPADFRGAVGKFAMSTTLDRKTTRTNEPISLKVTISGTGNIKLLESPALELPTDFEQYTPKVSDNISRQDDRISGSKVFEYLLIPRYPGLKVIKPVSFSYFDLGKREYVQLHSPQIELNVEQGAASPPPLVAGGNREDVRLLSQDIRFIKTAGGGFSRRGEMPWSSAWFVVAVLIPLAGLAGVVVYARRRRALTMDEVGYRNRRAIKIAKKGLKQAEYLLKESSGSQGTPSSKQRLRFYTEVSRALGKYLSDKLNIPQADFSVDAAARAMTERGAEHGMVHSTKVLLESCDMARFAPTGLGMAAMEKTYDEAKRVIIELERTLK